MILFFHIQDDSLQFFKELRTDTGLYNLYLKKVRYHTPSDQVGSTGDFGSSTTWYKTASIRNVIVHTRVVVIV